MVAVVERQWKACTRSRSRSLPLSHTHAHTRTHSLRSHWWLPQKYDLEDRRPAVHLTNLAMQGVEEGFGAVWEGVQVR